MEEGCEELEEGGERNGKVKRRITGGRDGAYMRDSWQSYRFKTTHSIFHNADSFKMLN